MGGESACYAELLNVAFAEVDGGGSFFANDDFHVNERGKVHTA